MNRLFAAALLSALLIYIGLYFYDTTNERRLDTFISAGLAVGFLLGAVHMLLDRTWREWNATAVAILMMLVSVGTLFALLFYQRQYGRLSSGQSQGWLDLVRATAIIGLPLFLAAIARYRYQKIRGEPAIRPSDQVTKAWDGVTERRSDEPGRRNYDYTRAEDREIRGITLSG
jgi:hypothetical protein